MRLSGPPLETLSGGITPRESMPLPVQEIMLFTPTTHFVRLAQAILYRGADLSIVWPPMLASAGIGLVFLGAALPPRHGANAMPPGAAAYSTNLRREISGLALRPFQHLVEFFRQCIAQDAQVVDPDFAHVPRLIAGAEQGGRVVNLRMQRFDDVEYGTAAIMLPAGGIQPGTEAALERTQQWRRIGFPVQVSGQRHPPRPVLDTGDDQGQFVAVNASLAGPVGIGLP